MLALLGPWDDHRIGGTVGDPSCHQGDLVPCRAGHGESEEPGDLVPVDLDNQENGLEELDCLGFGPELPFGQVGVPPFDWAWGLLAGQAWRSQFEIQGWRDDCIESEEGGEGLD